MTEALRPGVSVEHRHVVEADDTARALGSGDLDVLGTPRLLAWVEAATCAAIAPAMGAGDTSLGSRVRLEHLKPSPVGMTVTVRAEVTHVDGRLVRFQALAAHADGLTVAHAEITRVVVDEERFLSRLPQPQ